MKRNITLLIVAILLVGGIIGASSLYRHLSADYGNPSQLQDWTGGLGAQLPSNGGVIGGTQPDEGGDPVVPPAEGGGEIEPDEGGDPVLPPAEGGGETEPDEGGDPVGPPVEEPQKPIEWQAPDFTVLDENGNYIKLSDFAGKPIVVNFWATWCYYCKAEMADFNRAYEEFPDVQFVMVNATDGVRETVASAKKYVADNGFGFDLFFDVNGDAVRSYGITGFPSTFFINANGEPIAYASGMLDHETLVRGIGMIT